MISCINETIIGLSDIECDCFDLDKPIDFNTSDSGLFITDEFEIDDLKEMTDCSNGSVWDIMNKARKHGLLEFERNYKQNFRRMFKKKISDCKTEIGSSKIQPQTLTYSNQWVGMQIDSRNLSGTVLEIREINTFFSQTGTVDLHIYSNYSGGVIKTITLNTSAGIKNVNKLNEVICLPLKIDNCYDLKYYFVYEFDAANPPLNTAPHCGCSSKMCYSRYFGIKGIEYNTFPTDFDRFTASQSTSYGIQMIVTSYCDENALLCPLDLKSDTGVLIAEIVQHEAVLYMIAKALTGQKWNYDIETLQRKKGMVKELLYKRYDDLILDLNEKEIDCIACRGFARSVRL